MEEWALGWRPKERSYAVACRRNPGRRVSAGKVETAVMEQLSAVFRSPTLVVRTFFGLTRAGS